MKESSSPEIAQQAADAVRRCLADVPFLVVEETGIAPQQGLVAPTAILAVRRGNRRRSLLVEARSSGQPRVAREAVNSLILLRKQYPDAVAVFVAPFIAPRGAEICRQSGVSFVDLAGNCCLTFDQVYIRKEVGENPFARSRDLRSLYSPKAERILRVLLCDPRRPWRTQRLASEARVSLGQVANVKRLLANREWITQVKTGILLSDPEALLKEWAASYDATRSTPRTFYSLKGPQEVEAALARLGLDRRVSYALTGFSAAARLAPFVRTQQVEAYVSNSVDDIASALQLREVPSGANVRLIEPYDEGVYHGSSTIEGMQLVAPIQAYLDLRSAKGRGEEAAEFLLREAIIPRW